MDSGNSGSMQSSSGGDEDYDSRAESISALLNNPTTHHHVGPFPTNPQSQHHHMFDPLSNYFDPIQRSPSLSNPNSLLNLDTMWSKPGRSEPNPADLGALIPCSSSHHTTQNQAFFSSQLGGQSRGTAFPTTHHSLPPETSSRGLLSVSAANDQAHANTNSTNSNVVRNPKKRSRASRRAPTTVLTTDTTNFRAMVQEFTGIPAPPFTSSPFPRSRLDLFGSAAPSTLRSAHLDPPLPPYLLRPFAQKLQPPPHPFVSPSPTTTSSSSSMPSFPTTSSMVDTLASNPSNSTTNSSTSINYQLSSDLGLLKQPLNVNNMHNPVLNFQSILQPPPKYPPPNSSILAPKSQGSLEIPPSADSHLKMGVLEELGLNHAHVNANVIGLHQNMVSSSSDGAMTTRGNMGTNNDGDRGVVRSIGGNYSNTERVTNGIVNYLASSDFHGEKGPECVAAPRTEGMVESWINCSSD